MFPTEEEALLHWDGIYSVILNASLPSHRTEIT